ncbi:Phosphatidylinositol glycan anchor biosynthesis class S [Carabus blaptoides fortunei]
MAQEKVHRAVRCANLVALGRWERWRMISILSYVIVLIGFGIPIWWHTTRVYRASLPLEEMLQMTSMPAPPMTVYIHATSRAQVLSHEIQSVLGSTVIVSSYDRTVHLPASLQARDVEQAARRLQVDTGTLLFVEWPAAGNSIVSTSQRVVYFSSEVSGYQLAMLVEKWPGVELKTALADPKLTVLDTDTLRAYPATPKYDVLLTVVNPEPQHLKVDWDIVTASSDYLKPYLHSLSHVANFTLKSQWLYFVELGVNPRQVGDHWALAEQLLPHIITPLEKKLSSHVSKNPCINLVVYIPPCRMAPVHIYTKTGVKSSDTIDAFVSPRWGAVLITNPTCPNATFVPDSQRVMSVLVTQLSQLLGVPDIKSTTSGDVVQTGRLPALWQADYLLRQHTLEYLDAAKLTLRSLAQLLSEISNIVINDEVADSVHQAVANTAAAEHWLQDGQVLEAFGAAQRAAMAAESAFTDPSLLALLYFPDDQKYAVYIPLFLPIMIPVVMSMKQLVQYVM